MATSKKVDPRKMMERAVAVMRESMNEPRDDGKASPLVGAVLVKADGTVDSAYRGELRDGDHAEFTLLERKNRDVPLDGAKLFATLEPCAPGSRTHPKLGCAERVVLARIKEVWVGIEDPDPTVDRKGIKYLQDHGVTVKMFDRDLQEQIRELNKEFIDQALERKAAAEKDAAKPVALSSLESPVPRVELKDLDQDALEQYRAFLRGEGSGDSAHFFGRLVQQGLLKEQGQKLTPSGFGMLLFGKSPRDAMPQAGLLGTIHYADGREEVRDFDGPMVTIPEQAIQWLKDKLPNPIDRTKAQREDVLEKFYELAREGIVNALVHRDYDIAGAKCQLVVGPDSIQIKSPGSPVKPITVQQLQQFDAPMLSRNPMLHYVFSRMELAEERGLGLKSMRAGASAAGLPLPTYGFEDPYLVLTLYRSSEAAVGELPGALRAQLKDDERTLWQFIARKGSVTTPEVMAQMGFDERKAQRLLKKLSGTGLIRPVGRGRATRYERVSS